MNSDGNTVEKFTFEFWGDTHFEFTQGEDTLDAVRMIGAEESKIVRISVPEKFGIVQSVHVGNNKVASNMECHPSCTISAPMGGVITVENRWGGKLTTTIDLPMLKPAEPKDVQGALDANMNYIYYILTIGLVGFISYRVFFKFRTVYNYENEKS